MYSLPELERGQLLYTQWKFEPRTELKEILDDEVDLTSCCGGEVTGILEGHDSDAVERIGRNSSKSPVMTFL